MLNRSPYPWRTAKTWSLVTATLVLTCVSPARTQVTPEGPSTLNGAWTMRSLPPTAFPESAVPEGARLATTAEQLLRQGRRPDAVQAWQQAIAVDPSHPSAYWRLASVGSADTTERASLIRQQISAAPSPPAYLHGAVILQALGRADEALEVWREGVGRYPDDRNMAALFGEALLRRGFADEATALLEREALVRPNSSRLRFHLGRALIATGDPEAALTELRLAGRLENTPVMWYSLARVLATTQLDPDGALDFARRTAAAAEADSAAPSSPDLNLLTNTAISLARGWDVLSLVHDARDEVDAAESYGLAAWRLTADAQILTRLGLMYHRTGDTEAAVDYLARAAALEPSPGAVEARRTLESIALVRPVGELLPEGLARAQRSRMVTFLASTGAAVRVSLAIRSNRHGRVVDVQATGSDSEQLAPYLTAVRQLTLPGLPTGATVDALLAPWLLTCDASGACRLAPFVVPRSSPFDFDQHSSRLEAPSRGDTERAEDTGDAAAIARQSADDAVVIAWHRRTAALRRHHSGRACP